MLEVCWNVCKKKINQFVHVFLKVHVLGGMVSWFFWVHKFQINTYLFETCVLKLYNMRNKIS